MVVEKIVIVTQPTWLDGLIERFNTKQQARFYIEHMGGSFDDYQRQHDTYYDGLRQLKMYLPHEIRTQVVDKSFLPSFLFGPDDLVVVFGRDGLVINTAKYLDRQPIFGVNPDPATNVGVLLPYLVSDIDSVLKHVLEDKQPIREITMIKAETNRGQVIYGVNDIFVGHQSHQSARYIIHHQGTSEHQSSSGVVVSTGMGSTGWYKSIVLSAIKQASRFRLLGDQILEESEYRFDWSADYLRFCVREPWPSNTTGNQICFGRLDSDEELILESLMPEGGVIFGDGTEKDRIEFNSGTVVRISVADRKVFLYVSKL